MVFNGVAWESIRLTLKPLGCGPDVELTARLSGEFAAFCTITTTAEGGLILLTAHKLTASLRKGQM